jgi:hypothetical protein
VIANVILTDIEHAKAPLLQCCGQLLHYLLNFDLTKVNLRTIPDTAALTEQKIESLSVNQQWWLDVLKRGELPDLL